MALALLDEDVSCLREFAQASADVVFRKDPAGNKRKDYYAMTFERGHEIEEEKKERILEIVKEVHGKTTANKNFAEQWTPPNQSKEADEYPTEDINLDDVPF